MAEEDDTRFTCKIDGLNGTTNTTSNTDSVMVQVPIHNNKSINATGSSCGSKLLKIRSKCADATYLVSYSTMQ